MRACHLKKWYGFGAIASHKVGFGGLKPSWKQSVTITARFAIAVTTYGGK